MAVACACQAQGPQPALVHEIAAAPAVRHTVSDGVLLSARLSGAGLVTLDWQVPAGARDAILYRSTSDLNIKALNVIHYPITVEPLDLSPGMEVDSTVADNVPYFYQLQVDTMYSNVVEVDIPRRPLPPLARPCLRVDKPHYVLEVRDQGQVVKRYPIALGHNPVDRKLHQDNSTTPEGVYKISGVHPNTRFYDAYDVSYPNAVDRFRYTFAAQHDALPKRSHGLADIGGDIQIHGCGIRRNWTFGCIALRDEDMDELFKHDELGMGTPIEIVGSELSAEDLETIRTPLSDTQWAVVHDQLPALSRCSPEPRLLAQFQAHRGLPITGQMDTRTLQALVGTSDPENLHASR